MLDAEIVGRESTFCLSVRFKSEKRQKSSYKRQGSHEKKMYIRCQNYSVQGTEGERCIQIDCQINVLQRSLGLVYNIGIGRQKYHTVIDRLVDDC